jgi:predicted PurR-regulated permease PerM
MNLNRKNIKIILLIIVFTVFLVSALTNISVVLQIFGTFLSMISPFIIGIAIAFILNIPASFMENKLFKKIRFRRLKRTIAIILTILITLLILTIVVRIILPEVIVSIISIIKKIPASAYNINDWVNLKIQDNRYFELIQSVIGEKTQDIADIFTKSNTDIKNSVFNIMLSTFSVISGTISKIVSFIIGFVFAVYILFYKEKLKRQSKQIIYAFLPEKISDEIISIFNLTNRTFSNFVTGQCLESVILGGMFFISMIIFRIPYALILSILITIMALIPIVGAFIGCILGTALIFIDNPKKALIFIILFLVLQQIEGNLIYPHVVGNSVGLPSMWVLFAVTIGGKIMGIIGMLVFIPLSSVIYILVGEYIVKRLKNKKVSAWKYED